MKTNKLMLIQASLKAPKNQRNAFGNYNYRSCEDILEAVKPLLYETQTTLTISDDVVEVGGRIYVKATATLKECESWEIIESVSALARESETKKWMDESQITWASSSYARKYALNGLFCIDDTKDMDALNTGWKEEKTTKKGSSESKKDETQSDSNNPDWWFLKATKSTNFMKQCLDEDDFINKIKWKYTVGETEERQLREAYKNALGIDDDNTPDNLPFI